MTELARLFVILGGLVVLALSVALVGPYFVDWTSYRAEFEREASRVLGREVTVRGEASARLLPFPSVTFSDVEVAGTQPGQPAMTMEAFSMDAELAPFLRGELLIFDMRLVRPRAVLAIAEDGTVDWAIRPSTPFDASQVTLETLTVTEGRASIHHAASGRTHELTEINADISARTLAGPWRIDGSARIDGMMTGLGISTGAADETGRMRLRVRAEPERYAFGLETDGDATLRDGVLGYAGTFRLHARERADRLRGSGGDTFVLTNRGGAPARPAPPAYRVTGRFEIDHGAIGIPEFRFETGPTEDPYTAEGHASISLDAEPRFSIMADGAQLRFDEAQAAGETAAMALVERLAAFREAMLDFPKPIIPGTVEVNLPAIVAGDTTIRDVRLSAEPADGGWTLNSLAATLPGRATLEAEGLLRTSEEDFGFRGNLLLAVSQPSGFAAWLSKDVDEAIRRLPSAGFSARVELTERRQVFDDLEIILGGARFTGRIVDERPLGARSSMLVELDGGQLDVEGLAAFASLFVSERGGTRLAEHDFDFKVRAGPVTVAGVTAQSVDTQMRLREGELEIDRFSVDGLEGASVGATGTVRGIGSAPSGSIDASVIAGDLAPLAALLAARFPANAALVALDARAAQYPGLLEDAEIDVVASLAPADGDAYEVAASAQGRAGGGEFALTFSAAGDAARPLDTPFQVQFSASNEEPAALYALYGLPALPLGLADAARTELSMEGTLAAGAATRFSVEAEGFSARFDGKVGVADERMTAEGQASVEAADLEPWLMTAGRSLPGMGLGLPVELTGRIDLREGLLVVSGLNGKLADVAVSGDVNAELREGLPHLTGALEADAVDLALPAEALFGEAALQSDEMGWPRAPFAPSARLPFTAELQISADTLGAGPLSARAATFNGRLGPEGLRISDLAADFMGGRVAGLVELSNNDGTGLLSAQLSLQGAALETLLPDADIAGRGDLTASVTTSGKSVESMVASLAGSGTASVERLSLPGLRPDALPLLLAEADEAGPQINLEQTQAFAPDIVSGGRFEAEGAELALTIASGVVRAPPVRLEREEAILTVEPRLDLVRQTVGATGTIEYLAGADAMAGAEASVRFTVEGDPGEAEVSYDAEPLAQFLTQRALEREQARVEAMQAVLLERQRLRREVRYYAALAAERQRLMEEERRRFEEEQRRIEEEARLRAEEAAVRAAEEEALRAEEEARRAEEEARRAEEAALRAEEEARRAAEEEASRAAEEEARRAADEEARRAAEEEARRVAEEEARRLEEQETAARTQEAARRAEEEARRSEQELRPAGETIRRQPGRPPGAEADGLPGVQREPLALPSQGGNATPPPGVFSPDSLSVDNLLRRLP